MDLISKFSTSFKKNNSIYRLNKAFNTKIVLFGIILAALILEATLIFVNHDNIGGIVANASSPIPASTAISGTNLNYRNSWFANTHSGIDERAVVHSIDTIAVDQVTGSVYTNTFWEEGGMQISQYRNGEVMKTMPNTFGWGRAGGHAVAVNSQYVWGAIVYSGDDACAESPGNLNVNGLLDNRLCGTTWTGMARYKNTLVKGNFYDAEFANFPTGYATGAYLLIDPTNQDTHRCNPSGAYATETELFISDYCNNKIRVYNAETMGYLREFSVLKPGKLTMDKQGNLWVLSLKDTPADYQIGDFKYTYSDTEKILRYTPTGTKLPQELTGASVKYTRGIAVNSRNDLLVAIGGESDRANAKQQIFFYNNINSTPTFYKTFGQEGGYYGGPVKGEVKDGKFDWITGLAVDAQDNIYISMQKIGLASYKEDGTKNWQVSGLLFLDSTANDPRNPNIYYSKWDKLEFDPNRPDGSNWKHLARIYDFNQYPSDLRNWFAGESFDALPMRVCYLNETKFLVMSIHGGLAGYRFDKTTQGEIAIPAFEVMPGTNLINEVYIWTDSNGDGLRQPAEKVTESGDINFAPAKAVDEDCGLWFGQSGKKNVEDNITHYNPTTLKVGGFSPDYTIAEKKVYKTPNIATNEELFEPTYRTEGGNLLKLQYDKAMDVMYLSGHLDVNTPAVNSYDPRTVGSKLHRFNNWSNPSTRSLAWTVDIPSPVNGDTTKGTNLTLAGDYIIIGEERGDYGQFLYNKNTGQRYFLASDVQGDYGLGWLDIPYGAVLLNYREDGTYVLTTEDDHYSKSFTYHIKPNSHNSIVTGKFYFDTNNSNSLDNGENGENLPAGTKIKLTSATNSNLVFYPVINSGGDFAQSLPSGTYNIQYELPNGFQVGNASLTSVIADANMITTLDETNPIAISNSSQSGGGSTLNQNVLFIFDDKITVNPNPITNGLSVYGKVDYTFILKDDRIVEGGSSAVCTYRVKELSASPNDPNKGYNQLTSTIISPHNNGGNYNATSTIISSTPTPMFEVNYNSTNANTGTSIKIAKENQQFTTYNLEIRCKRNSDGQLFARDQIINFLFGALGLVSISGSGI